MDKRIPTVAEARDKLNRAWKQRLRIEAASGMSPRWLQMFANGEIANPRINSLIALSDACDVVLADMASVQPADSTPVTPSRAP